MLNSKFARPSLKTVLKTTTVAGLAAVMLSTGIPGQVIDSFADPVKVQAPEAPSFADVVSAVSPAVVSVRVQSETQMANDNGNFSFNFGGQGFEMLDGPGADRDDPPLPGKTKRQSPADAGTSARNPRNPAGGLRFRWSLRCHDIRHGRFLVRKSLVLSCTPESDDWFLSGGLKRASPAGSGVSVQRRGSRRPQPQQFAAFPARGRMARGAHPEDHPGAGQGPATITGRVPMYMHPGVYIEHVPCLLWGFVGLWQRALQMIDNFKQTIIGGIQDFVINSLIMGGLSWLAGLSNPVGAVIKIALAIYNQIKIKAKIDSGIAALVQSNADLYGLGKVDAPQKAAEPGAAPDA